MEIRELTTFLEVANLKSFSRAAEKLGYSQAAVTIQIRQLEKELGTRLFNRIGKQTTTTYQGDILCRYAADILRSIHEARDTLTDQTSLHGTLRIGTTESICSSIFPELLCRYHSAYPEVIMSITTDSPDRLLDMMNHDLVDIVYLVDKRIYDSNWIKELEQSDDIVFVTASVHPLCQKRQIPVDVLLKEPFILTEKDASYRFLLEQYLASCHKEIKPYLSIGNTDFIVRLLEDNQGISFLPRFMIRCGLEQGTLSVLDVAGFHMQIWRQIFYHKDKWVTQEMHALIRMAHSISSCGPALT